MTLSPPFILRSCAAALVPAALLVGCLSDFSGAQLILAPDAALDAGNVRTDAPESLAEAGSADAPANVPKCNFNKLVGGATSQVANQNMGSSSSVSFLPGGLAGTLIFNNSLVSFAAAGNMPYSLIGQGGGPALSDPVVSAGRQITYIRISIGGAVQSPTICSVYNHNPLGDNGALVDWFGCTNPRVLITYTPSSGAYIEQMSISGTGKSLLVRAGAQGRVASSVPASTGFPQGYSLTSLANPTNFSPIRVAIPVGATAAQAGFSTLILGDSDERVVVQTEVQANPVNSHIDLWELGPLVNGEYVLRNPTIIVPIGASDEKLVAYNHDKCSLVTEKPAGSFKRWEWVKE